MVGDGEAETGPLATSWHGNKFMNPITDGAVLAAMNVADKYCKERQVSDNLRAQLKQALDENARLARELAEAKREARKAARGEKGTKAPKQGPRQEET